MLKTLTENRVFNHLRNLRLVEKLWIQGLILAIVLIVIQMPVGKCTAIFYGLYAANRLCLFYGHNVSFQPIMIGVLNIFVINTLYKTKGWQVGFWLNGIFLLLTFSTINIVLQTSLNLSFAYVAVIDIVLLALPFGSLARFSNGGWKKPID